MTGHDQVGAVPGQRQRKSQAWIFQANPKRYDIHTALRVEHLDMWNLNQYATEVAAGDQVVVWICGPKAGIYALGSVTSDPVIQEDSVIGMKYWTSPKEGKRPKARVWVRYNRVLLDRPLLKVYIEADPALWKLTILRQARGTNFRVRDDEWQALQEWFAQI
jgi:EVE domain